MVGRWILMICLAGSLCGCGGAAKAIFKAAAGGADNSAAARTTAQEAENIGTIARQSDEPIVPAVGDERGPNAVDEGETATPITDFAVDRIPDVAEKLVEGVDGGEQEE